VFFPEAYEKHWQLLKDDAKLLVKGKFSNRDDERKLMASIVKPLEALPILHLTLPPDLEGGSLLALRNEIAKSPGDTPVVFHFTHTADVVLAGEQFRVDPTEQLVFDLKRYLGVGHVRLEDAAGAAAPGLAMSG
jgi:DNA polymerase III alpha subunit